MTTYKVVPNWCNCHPETCCCNSWKIVNENDEKHSTHYSKDKAELFTTLLNQQSQNTDKPHGTI